MFCLSIVFKGGTTPKQYIGDTDLDQCSFFPNPEAALVYGTMEELNRTVTDISSIKHAIDRTAPHFSERKVLELLRASESKNIGFKDYYLQEFMNKMVKTLIADPGIKDFYFSVISVSHKEIGQIHI